MSSADTPLNDVAFDPEFVAVDVQFALDGAELQSYRPQHQPVAYILRICNKDKMPWLAMGGATLRVMAWKCSEVH